MSDRLSHIYTGGGDQGKTSLADGSRLGKDDPRIEVMGTLDELNSVLGVLLSNGVPATLARQLDGVQQMLFELGSEMAVPGRCSLHADDVATLEAAIDEINADLPSLAEFILPGGIPAAAYCHFARAICRRAERQWVRLQSQAESNPEALRYLNRLSDFLFVAARSLNQGAGQQEPLFVGFRKLND